MHSVKKKCINIDQVIDKTLQLDGLYKRDT